MPNSPDCGERDFSCYDDMSTEQLQQFLREDASKSEGEESDTALVLYVMEVLAKRRRENSPGKSPEEALASFKEQYDTQNLFISENTQLPNTHIPNAHGKRSWLRGLAAVLALAVLLFVGSTVTAKAFGFDLWGTIAKWTKEAFYFVPADQDNDELIPEKDDSKVYEGLKSATLESQMESCKLPHWIPDGYTEADIRVMDTPMQRQIIAKYENEDKIITIRIALSLTGNPERVEWSEDLVEVYTTNNVDYYIFSNLDRLNTVWSVGSYECYILGPLSIDEMKIMIDSIN